MLISFFLYNLLNYYPQINSFSFLFYGPLYIFFFISLSSSENIIALITINFSHQIYRFISAYLEKAICSKRKANSLEPSVCVTIFAAFLSELFFFPKLLEIEIKLCDLIPIFYYPLRNKINCDLISFYLFIVSNKVWFTFIHKYLEQKAINRVFTTRVGGKGWYRGPGMGWRRGCSLVEQVDKKHDFLYQFGRILNLL